MYSKAIRFINIIIIIIVFFFLKLLSIHPLNFFFTCKTLFWLIKILYFIHIIPLNLWIFCTVSFYFNTISKFLIIFSTNWKINNKLRYIDLIQNSNNSPKTGPTHCIIFVCLFFVKYIFIHTNTKWVPLYIYSNILFFNNSIILDSECNKYNVYW